MSHAAHEHPSLRAGDPRPKLLVVCPVPIWPVEDGYALRVAALLPNLSRQWQIALIAPVRAGAASDPPRSWNLARFEPLRLDAGWTHWPWQYDTAPVRRAASSLIATFEPDVALLFGGAEYLRFGDREFPPAVSDHIDCFALISLAEARVARTLPARLRQLREALRAARYESRVVREMWATTVVGERDAKAMRRLGIGGRVVTLPNGVDAAAGPSWERAAPAPTVVFSGVLDYPPNTDAAQRLAREIWPLVAARVPGAALRIVGRRPPPELQALSGPLGVAVVGDVPDMNCELARAWVAAAPMRTGTGVKNKVLEAWATGRPVVLSRLACNGLELPPELEVLVADSPSEVADRLVELLGDTARRQQLGSVALAHVRARYDWRDVAARLDELLRGAAATGARRAAVGFAKGPRASAS